MIPKVSFTFVNNSGKRVASRLIPSKINFFARVRARNLLKNGSIDIFVHYPDGMENRMTAKSMSDVKWAIDSFYKEYKKDWL